MRRLIYASRCSVVFTMLLRIAIYLQFVFLIVHVTTFASFVASTLLCVFTLLLRVGAPICGCAPGSACSCSPVVFTSLLCVALVLVTADLYMCVHVADVLCLHRLCLIARFFLLLCVVF